jgi:hypothetical protein
MRIPGTTNWLDKAEALRRKRVQEEQRAAETQKSKDDLRNRLEKLGFAKIRFDLTEDELASQQKADQTLISIEGALMPLEAIVGELREREIDEA